MSVAKLTPAQIDALIDTLDHAERNQPLIWRKPLLDLQERLSKARRLRRWIGAVLLGVALLTPGPFTSDSRWTTWVGYSLVLGAILLMLMQIALERLNPVLDRENRIQALRDYFLPWSDVDEVRRVEDVVP